MIQLQYPLRGVISDWNGTLLNDLHLVYGSVCEIYRHYNMPPPSLSAYQREITADFMRFYWKYGVPITATADDLNVIRREYFKANWNSVELHPHALRTLLRMRDLNLQMGIVSSEVDSILKERVMQFEIDACFKHIQGGVKDKTFALLNTCDVLGILPEECVYVDDTFDGITSALAAGMRAIGMTHGYNLPEHIHEAQPDPGMVANSWPEALAIIERLMANPS